MTQLRVVAAERHRIDNKPDPASSILKIKGSEIQQATTELLLEIVGPYAMPYQPEHDEDERWNEPPIGPEWAGPIAPDLFQLRAKSRSTAAPTKSRRTSSPRRSSGFDDHSSACSRALGPGHPRLSRCAESVDARMRPA